MWLMLVGAGLLATSPPYDGSDPVPPVWSGPGPSLTLSDATPAQTFVVTVLAPKLAEGASQSLTFAQIALSVSAIQSGGDGSAGQAGAAPVPGAGDPPWASVTLRDASDMALLESTPFLSTWGSTTDLAFSGDCAAPDPAGADPCRLSFSVEFERSPSGNAAETALHWSMSITANGAAQPGAAWTAEIEPL